MTSYLIDLNVWIALTWGLHVNHKSAARWEKSRTNTPFLFCRFTMLGFIRLLTTKPLMSDSTLTISGALNVYDVWLQDPRVEFRQEPRGMNNSLRRFLGQVGSQSAPKAVADCYLAAFAQSSGASLVTFDGALAKLCKQQDVAVELLPSD